MNEFTKKDHWLSAKEISRITTLLHARGATKVRLTGGEPLLRPDVVDVVAAIRDGAPSIDLALTTNGEHLLRLADALCAAGLRRVTVHIDTLRPERYGSLMGASGPLHAIIDAVTMSKALGLGTKLNVVVQRGRNDDEILSFLDWSRETSVEVRFIELMNTGSAEGYVSEVFMSGRDIVDVVKRGRGVRQMKKRHPSDPASLFSTDDDVVFGVIASDTEPFCADCDRLRLSAEGRLRGCLYESGGVPLGAAVRAGADDEQLRALIDVGLDDKRSHHPSVLMERKKFSMADIGG